VCIALLYRILLSALKTGVDGTAADGARNRTWRQALPSRHYHFLVSAVTVPVATAARR